MLSPSLTTADVAARLNVTPLTIKRWIRERRIPSYRIGGVRRFDPVEIEKWIDAHREGDAR